MKMPLRQPDCAKAMLIGKFRSVGNERVFFSHAIRWITAEKVEREFKRANVPGRVGVPPEVLRNLRSTCRRWAAAGGAYFPMCIGRLAQRGGRDAHPTRDIRQESALLHLANTLFKRLKHKLYICLAVRG